MKKIVLIFILAIYSSFAQTYSDNSVYFVRNEGQWDSQIISKVKIGKMSVYITQNGVVYNFYNINQDSTFFNKLKNKDFSSPFSLNDDKTTVTGHIVKMSFEGAEQNPKEYKGLGLHKDYNNYYIGGDSTKWKTRVPLYDEIIVKNMYDGIDVRYYFENAEIDNKKSVSLRYDFIIHPGADPMKIKMKFEGQNALAVNEEGELLIQTCLGEVKQCKLFAYQSTDNSYNNADNDKTASIQCSFSQNPDATISFSVGEYNKDIALVIDPLVMAWSTYYGGSEYDGGGAWPTRIGINDNGNIYLAGNTLSNDAIASPGAYQTVKNSSMDVVLVKFDSSGIRQWGTYYGGEALEHSSSLVIDNSNNIYIVGSTSSTSGMASAGAYSSNYNGGSHDAFIAKFNSAGARLWATYYGGLGYDYILDIEIDSVGYCYIAGYTSSENGISSPGAFQTTYSGNKNDGFFAKFNADGDFLWGSYYGEGGSDIVCGMCIDNSNNLYLIGSTSQQNNFSTANAHQVNYGGGNRDGFLSKFNSNGARLWSTYYGGSLAEDLYGISIYKNYIYIVGVTQSTNNISSYGAHQYSVTGNSSDGFLAKFSSNGVREWGTYYGGNNNDIIFSVVNDKYGNVFIAGSTNSPDKIATSGTYQDINLDYDGFLAKFNSSGKRQWGTYWGGSSLDYGQSITIDSSNNIILFGRTVSNDIPVYKAHQSSYAGDNDFFITKFRQSNSSLYRYLVGYWPFCGNANDKSGNNNNGTVRGATLTNDRFGNPGQAYLFDGINDYIEIPDAPALNIESSITMSSWIKTTSGKSDCCIIGKWNGGSVSDQTQSYNQLLRNGYCGGSVNEITDQSNRADNTVFGNSKVNNGVWNHIVYVADNNTRKIRIYINGSLNSEYDVFGTSDIIKQTTSKVLIGIRDLINNDNSWFDGVIDDIRLYDCALTTTDIIEMYRVESEPLVTNLVAAPASIIIGNRTCLGDTVVAVTLTNTSLVPINVTETSFAKGTGSKLTVSNGGAFTLPADDTRELEIRIKTTAAGNLNDTLLIYYPDECNPVLRIPISGYRDTIGVKLSVSDTVDIGKICQNSYFLDTIEVFNTSSRATFFKINELLYPLELVAPSPFYKIFKTVETKLLIIQFTGTDLGFYYRDIIITDTCGKETKVTLKAEVYELNVNAGPDQSFCESDSVRIGVDDHAGLASNKYSWSPKTGLASPDSLLTMASPDTTTDYILTITDANGCTAKDTVRLTFSPKPDIKIYPADSITLCDGAYISLIASPTGMGYQYEWSNGETNKSITVMYPGTYKLKITNENGCSNTDSVVVLLGQPFDLSADKPELDFGDLDACESEKLDSITITNNSTNACIDLVSIDCDNSAFKLVSPLPSVKIKPKESQKFIIKFSAQTQGNYSGVFVFVSECRDTFKLDVKGNKLEAGVFSDLTEIDFGTNCKPLTIDTTITIYNKTKSIVTLLEPITSTPFSIISPSFSVTLNSLDEIQVKVRYSPTVEGIYNSVMKFPYQSSACPDDTISVIIKGSVQSNTLETPELIVMPQLCECEIPKDTVITITNKSSVADTIYKITTDENVGYSVPTPLPIIIEPGASVQLTIKWNPQNMDSVSSVVKIDYNPCENVHEITVTGWKNGIGFYPPDSIIFNELVLCRDTIEIQELTLKNKNCSQETARIISYNINSSAFSIDINPNDTLPFDGYKTYHLRYSPKTEADTSAVLEIRYMPCDTVKKIILKGKITGPVLSIDDVDYGYIPINQSKSKQIEIKNEGTIADTIYEINGVVLPFSYDPASPSFPIIIEPGKAFTFSVKYAPQAMRNDTILITAKMKPCDLLANAELTGNCASIPKTVVFIDTASAEVGSETVLNLLMTNGLNLSYYGITDYEATFRYNATVLCPKEPFAADHDSIAFDERIMKISGKIPAQLNGTKDTLRAMRFTAALGNSECSEMKLDTVLLYGGAYEIKLLNGRFCLSNICKEGGKRLFYGSGKTELLSIIPNPADEEITIILNTIEEGETSLNIYNSIGMKVYESNIINTKTGVKEISINTSNLSAGVYFIKLQTPTFIDYKKLVINR